MVRGDNRIPMYLGGDWGKKRAHSDRRPSCSDPPTGHPYQSFKVPVAEKTRQQPKLSEAWLGKGERGKSNTKRTDHLG